MIDESFSKLLCSHKGRSLGSRNFDHVLPPAPHKALEAGVHRSVTGVHSMAWLTVRKDGESYCVPV